MVLLLFYIVTASEILQSEIEEAPETEEAAE